MKNQEAINKAIAKMSNKQKAEIFPPIERKNFVSCHVGLNESTGLNQQTYQLLSDT